jgi:hypothetical protein
MRSSAFDKMNILIGIVLFAFAGLTQAAPEILCEQPVFYFGERNNTAKIRHTFTLKNVGDAVLKLGEAKTSCGCTRAGTYLHELLPGETTRVTLQLDLRRRYGVQNKFITIPTNDPRHKHYKLFVNGVALAKIRTNPDSLVLGAIEPNTPLTRIVRIYSTDGLRFKLSGIKAKLGLVKTELKTIKEGEIYDLTVHVPPVARTTGQVNDLIYINTDHKDLPYFSIQVRGVIRDALIISPNPVDLLDTTRVRYVYIRAGAVSEYTLLEATWPDPAAKVEVLPATHFGERIRISNIQINDAVKNGHLVLQTDIPGKETIQVPIRVTETLKSLK